MITQKSVWGEISDRLTNDVLQLVGSGVPTDGVIGAGLAGIGSSYVDIVTGINYINKGTKASPSWKAVTTA